MRLGRLGRRTGRRWVREGRAGALLEPGRGLSRRGERGDNALFLRTVKNAHYLWPILGNQPTLNQTLNALPWQDAPVAAATCEITRGRIETRTLRVLPCPGGTGFEGAEQALLIERYATYKKKGQWHTRAEAVLYLTSLTAQEATPEDLLAHVRGHWRVEHAHWLPRRDLERG